MFHGYGSYGLAQKLNGRFGYPAEFQFWQIPGLLMRSFLKGITKGGANAFLHLGGAIQRNWFAYVVLYGAQIIQAMEVIRMVVGEKHSMDFCHLRPYQLQSEFRRGVN
jgi:hypothetical protein